MENLYTAYKDKVQFFLVYTREVHPKSQGGRRSGSVIIEQHDTLQDRMIAADKCMKGLKLTIPLLLDSMDNQFLKGYGGIPAGTTVIDIHGKVAYWNRGSPNGCKPDRAEETITRLLKANGAAIAEKWSEVKVPRDLPRAKPEQRRLRWF